MDSITLHYDFSGDSYRFIQVYRKDFKFNVVNPANDVTDYVIEKNIDDYNFNEIVKSDDFIKWEKERYYNDALEDACYEQQCEIADIM